MDFSKKTWKLIFLYCVAVNIGAIVFGFSSLRPLTGDANTGLGCAALMLAILNCVVGFRYFTRYAEAKSLLPAVLIGAFVFCFGVVAVIGKVTDGDLEYGSTDYKDGLAITKVTHNGRPAIHCDQVIIPALLGKAIVNIEAFDSNESYDITDCQILTGEKLQVTLKNGDNQNQLITRTVDLSSLTKRDITIADLVGIK